ncbi:Polyadenylate-binding protein 2 [Triticum urartu]|uniref:Polyadenylate-binding protein 2 n=1 Tax=Triticum urartu TaxID=4572 RepID=M7ZHL2_TRIUA|nr:Polyadenylate-binding protein 2 [Triticum urartu]
MSVTAGEHLDLTCLVLLLLMSLLRWCLVHFDLEDVLALLLLDLGHDHPEHAVLHLGLDLVHPELDEMKRRLKEMEEEAAALRDMQAKVAKEMQGGDANASTAEAKEQVDARSVYVGNLVENVFGALNLDKGYLRQKVDYACTPEEVQQHFQACGTVNRVTILTDKFGQPKGFAYVEFLEQEAVQEALNLNESELHGRQIKVSPKRTNVPGMKQRPPRGFNPYHAYPYRSYGAPYFPPYGYGRVPRFRRPTRYRPYF